MSVAPSTSTTFRCRSQSSQSTDEGYRSEDTNTVKGTEKTTKHILCAIKLYEKSKTLQNTGICRICKESFDGKKWHENLRKHIKQHFDGTFTRYPTKQPSLNSEENVITITNNRRKGNIVKRGKEASCSEQILSICNRVLYSDKCSQIDSHNNRLLKNRMLQNKLTSEERKCGTRFSSGNQNSTYWAYSKKGHGVGKTVSSHTSMHWKLGDVKVKIRRLSSLEKWVGHFNHSTSISLSDNYASFPSIKLSPSHNTFQQDHTENDTEVSESALSHNTIPENGMKSAANTSTSSASHGTIQQDVKTEGAVSTHLPNPHIGGTSPDTNNNWQNKHLFEKHPQHPSHAADSPFMYKQQCKLCRSWPEDADCTSPPPRLYDSLHSLNRHVLKAHVLSEESFSCDECPIKFQQQISLQMHMHYSHSKGLNGISYDMPMF